MHNISPTSPDQLGRRQPPGGDAGVRDLHRDARRSQRRHTRRVRRAVSTSPVFFASILLFPIECVFCCKFALMLARQCIDEYTRHHVDQANRNVHYHQAGLSTEQAASLMGQQGHERQREHPPQSRRRLAHRPCVLSSAMLFISQTAPHPTCICNLSSYLSMHLSITLYPTARNEHHEWIAPSNCELATVLHRVSKLKILGDYSPRFETVALDNVKVR